jgi:MarR family transcriptional regulator, transcriptional regulator for hemolysin
MARGAKGFARAGSRHYLAKIHPYYMHAYHKDTMMVRPRTARRELLHQLVETSRLLRTHVDQRARQLGTTRAQWGVLSRLAWQEGLMQADLAGQLEIQPISLTRLIDRLERQGYIERRADLRDRRIYRLHLTQAGRAFTESLDPAGDDIAGEALSFLDDARVATMTKTLEAIKERLKQLGGDDNAAAPVRAA